MTTAIFQIAANKKSHRPLQSHVTEFKHFISRFWTISNRLEAADLRETVFSIKNANGDAEHRIPL